MKLLALAFASIAFAAPSKTVQLAVVHAVRGCHTWHTTRDVGPALAVKLPRGGMLQIRVSCPMDFRMVQVRGRAVTFGDSTFHTGTMRTIVFPKRGVYVFTGTNLESSADLGLQTLGADNVLRLTVTVT
jgi:hypothetical protein